MSDDVDGWWVWMRMRSGRGSEVGISSLSKKALIPGRREAKVR